MEQIKLFDSELKLMELIWQNENISAKELSIIANEVIGWNKNTTYTVLKKLVAKKAVLRVDPNFICVPAVTKEQIQYDEANALVDKLYNGSVNLLFSSFLSNGKLSKTEREQLRHMIDLYDEGGE
jgi:predicted transcriptional regulator